MTYVLNQTRRPGKTQRDRESGAQARNEANKRARVAWQHGDGRRGSNPFPKTACNGKKNRHRTMEKGANYVVHS